MDYRRRSYLADSGEPLILTRSAFALAQRFAQFANDTQLPSTQVSSNPLVAVPFPVASKQTGPRGWSADTNPEIFWHPLFWLPERVAYRYRFAAEGGPEDFESETEWAVRVGLEVTMSGLYNPADGSWLDVLSTVGLDVAELGVQQRISAWLAGSPDEALDSIDLSEFTELPEDPHWAVESAAELIPTLQPASWALLADDLARELGEIPEMTDVSEASGAAATIAHLAIGTLGSVPARAPGESAPAVDWAAIAELAEDFPGDLDDLLTSCVGPLSDLLFAVRDDYWPFVVALDEEISGQDEADAGPNAAA